MLRTTSRQKLTALARSISALFRPGPRHQSSLPMIQAMAPVNGVGTEQHNVLQNLMLASSAPQYLSQSTATVASLQHSRAEHLEYEAIQASQQELFTWMTDACGLHASLAEEYAAALLNSGFDSPAALAMTSAEELIRLRIRTGHARLMLSKLMDLKSTRAAGVSGGSGLPPPRLFDHATITSNVTVADAIEAVEQAFGRLAAGKVDVPLPMHIGIEQTDAAGPGDCHIKGGYVSGEQTFTVKLACVSFYKNVETGLPPGSGVFVVMSAVTGQPLAIMHENRYLTDLRTGAAGAVAVKHLTFPEHDKIGFLGTGAIAKNMARAAAAVRPFKGFAFSRRGAGEFCKQMEEELGMPFTACDTTESLCRKSDVLFTQTTGSEVVLDKSWLKPHVTVIASGSDQPTKQELPVELLARSKYISDLTKQTARVGELRSALAASAMTQADVHAELGQIVNGTKAGRKGNETIVVDLTGTGAQDAAIGQVAWEKLRDLK